MNTVAAAIVSYFSESQALTATVMALALAAQRAECRIHLTVVDNSEEAADRPRLARLLNDWLEALAPSHALTIDLLGPGANLGYGGGNNLALRSATERFILVLNPDVIVEPDALKRGLSALETDPTCAMVTPRALAADGSDLHLGHAYPSILALAGRAIHGLQRFERVRKSMASYELRDQDLSCSHDRTICASGCFMLMRDETWRASGGFDPAFFLYFEDYDFSLRLASYGHIRYLPDVRLVHLGGDASGKGLRHTRFFLMSAFRFFGRHGLRWT